MEATAYSATVVLGFHRVELIECGVSGDEGIRWIEARLDGKPLGQLRLLASFFPSFALRHENHSDLVVWTEAEVYLLRLDENLVKFYDHSDAVHAAYGLGEHWCLVGDASVALVDLFLGVEILRYDHDEIFTSSTWEGSKLVVGDLQGRIFRFESLDPSKSALRPVPQALQG
ncbi:MAG: hypothetical protein GY835_04995 [bacterium]|nr:hypothetical protein [bacterium]